MNELLKITEHIGYKPTFYYKKNDYYYYYFDSYYTYSEESINDGIDKDKIAYCELCLLQKFIEEKYKEYKFAIQKYKYGWQFIFEKQNLCKVYIENIPCKTEILKQGLTATVEYIINNEINEPNHIHIFTQRTRFD